MDILERLEKFVIKKDFESLENRLESVLDICVEHFKESAERCEELEDIIETLEYKIEELTDEIIKLKKSEVNNDSE